MTVGGAHSVMSEATARDVGMPQSRQAASGGRHKARPGARIAFTVLQAFLPPVPGSKVAHS